jgi:hypothetical protein
MLSTLPNKANKARGQYLSWWTAFINHAPEILTFWKKVFVTYAMKHGIYSISH